MTDAPTQPPARSPDSGRSATPPRVCPECGADRWRVRDAARTYQLLSSKTNDADNLARQNGLLSYQLQDARAAISALQSRMQRKIVRQARVITRLERRLREQGARPYEGAGLEETSTGAEHDAGQVLPGEEADGT